MKINKKNIWPVILMAIIYFSSYYIPKIVVSESRYHFVMHKIDNLIPLFSPSVFVYVGAFFQWMFAAILLLCMDTDKSYRYLSGIIYGSIFAFIVFMVYPTAIIRPNMQINTFSDMVLNIVYSCDSILNSVPSLHCFLSTVVLYIFNDSKMISRNAFLFNCVFSILVYMSTVLTKQHFFIDVPTGIILGLVSIYIGNRHPLTKLFNKLTNHI